MTNSLKQIHNNKRDIKSTLDAEPLIQCAGQTLNLNYLGIIMHLGGRGNH